MRLPGSLIWALNRADSFKRYIGYFKGRYNFSPSSSLTFFTNSLYQNSGTFLYWKNSRNALVPPDADQGERTTSFRSMYAVVYKSVLSRDLFLNVNSAYYRTDWKDQTSSMNHSLANLYRTEIQTGYNISPDIMLVSGIAGSISGVSSNIFGDPGAFGFGVYSQADVNFGKNFLLSAGVRYDYNKLDSLGGSNAVSPKLGVNYKVSENLTLRSSLGTGFRSPTLAEAFTSTTASGITIEPNPDLKPEHNFNVEVGANYQLNSFINLDLALFQNEFYDFIEPGVNPADGRFFFGNITRARIRGIEFETEAGLLNDRLQLSADYTYLWARDLQKGTQLKYRPLNNVTLRADYKFGIFSAGADFRYHSKVEQMDFELVDLGVVRDGRLRVPVYVLNLRAGCDFREFGIPGRAYLNANNVLNYNYVELMANIAPIRNFSLSLEFLF